MRRIGNKKRKTAPSDWQERAVEILEREFPDFEEIDYYGIEDWVIDHWQNLDADTANIEAFMKEVCDYKGLDFDNLVLEFNDGLNSDPKFNYKPTEFYAWFNDLVLAADKPTNRFDENLPCTISARNGTECLLETKNAVYSSLDRAFEWGEQVVQFNPAKEVEVIVSQENGFEARKFIQNYTHHNPWRCERCGSPDVQHRVWINPNSKEIVRIDDCDRSDYYCEECEENRYTVRESELMNTVQEWWGQTDFKEMKRVTRYRQFDFSSADGYQKFVDACNAWWDGHTAEEKIGIWREQTKN